jgi:hypothetical protein
LDLVNTGIGTEVQMMFSFENSANVSLNLSLPSSNRLLINQTYHVVGTYDGTTAIIYVNGNEARRTTSVGVGGIRSSSIAAPIIGAGRGGSWPRAVVDEVAWYSGVLSLARVQAHYQAGNPGAFFDAGTATVTASGTKTESYSSTDIRSGTIIVSGSGVEDYVSDTTAPIPTVTVVDVTKISRVIGKDVINVTFTTDEAFVEYEIRRVSSGSDSQAAGNQVETAVVSSRTSHSTAITDDELVAAAAVEGSNTLKCLSRMLPDNWST